MNEEQITMPFANEDGLRVIRKMAEKLVELTENKKAKEAELDELSKEIGRLSTQTIPDLMDEMGVDLVNFSDGKVIRKDTFYSGNVPEGKWNDFESWAMDTGNEAMIQNEIRVKGTRKDQEEFERAKKALTELGVGYEHKKGIHHKTLQSLIKELYETGKPVPDCINHYVGSIAKYK